MNPFTSLAVPVDQQEEMDAAELPAVRYARVLADLARVNRMTLAARPTLAFVRAALRRRVADAAPLRVLDVGFGDGAMLRAIGGLCERLGVTAELVGIDLNPRSADVAAARTPPPPPGIRHDWRSGDYAALAGTGWDIVISNLVTHHMSDGERRQFLRFMANEARIGWFINDLHRTRFAFAGYPLLASLMRTDPIVRRDGQLSIARSFRTAEWEAMLQDAGIAGADISRWVPSRLCVTGWRAA